MTPLPIVTFVRPVQLSNVLDSILLTPLGIVTRCNPEQKENASVPISVTPLGIVAREKKLAKVARNS